VTKKVEVSDITQSTWVRTITEGKCWRVLVHRQRRKGGAVLCMHRSSGGSSRVMAPHRGLWPVRSASVMRICGEDLPASFINVSSSKHSCTQEGRTICLCLGLLISFFPESESWTSLLRGPPAELYISTRVIVIDDDMREFGVIQVGGQFPAVIDQRFCRFVQPIVSV
jgi:hypothetical protein